MKTIKTLKELRDLFESGKLSEEKGDTLYIDNDSTGLWGEQEEYKYNGPGPESLLEEALDLLGIPHEPV